jgi:hypothetical protein
VRSTDEILGAKDLLGGLRDAESCETRRVIGVRQKLSRASSSRGKYRAMDFEGLTRAYLQACATQRQMSPAQYFRIALELLARAPCRLLIVGAGNDTELYVRANPGGHTVVVERHADWLAMIRKLDCVPALVTYRTQVNRPPLEPCSVPDGIPSSVLEERWDVILIDGPEGWRSKDPGRQQSIFLAAQLARTNTLVFLHDYERPLERTFANRYLKAPDETYGETRVLAAFRYGASSSSPRS